ncbi:MAG: hypothetical protein ACK5B9_09425 [Flavobacteriia bacterium]|jgi:hypothetical protein
MGQKFKLWLEFEEVDPNKWDNEIEFCNIHVDFEDGRLYGINVWTYKFLLTEIEDDKKTGQNLSGLYQKPPDLFVKELTRDSIQSAIEDLLRQGNLEDLLNSSIFGLSFKAPWCDVLALNDLGEHLKKELDKEISSTHPLFERSMEIIAKRQDNDDVLIRLSDGKLATVHLTWSGKTEQGNYPLTKFYFNDIDFWSNKMKFDIIEFNE